jgi:hypothetical protein
LRLAPESSFEGNQLRQKEGSCDCPACKIYRLAGRGKKERHRLVCERSLAAFDAWWHSIPLPVAELHH